MTQGLLIGKLLIGGLGVRNNGNAGTDQGVFRFGPFDSDGVRDFVTRNLPTKIIPILGFADSMETSGQFPMDMRIPPLTINIMIESNPPKSRILVRRLAVYDIT